MGILMYQTYFYLTSKESQMTNLLKKINPVWSKTSREVSCIRT